MKKSNKGFLQGEALKGIFDGGASLIKKQQMEHLIQYFNYQVEYHQQY